MQSLQNMFVMILPSQVYRGNFFEFENFEKHLQQLSFVIQNELRLLNSVLLIDDDTFCTQVDGLSEYLKKKKALTIRREDLHNKHNQFLHQNSLRTDENQGC